MKRFSQWQTPPKSRLPANLANWLRDQGSLTRRLEVNSRQGISVALLRCDWQKPTIDEARALGIDYRQKVFCRQVLLMDGNVPRVFARTVVPRRSYGQLRQDLNALGNRSLGAWLFSDAAVIRSRIKISCLPATNWLAAQACQAAKINCQSLWARRSAFQVRGKTLLVSELFLPATGSTTW